MALLSDTNWFSELPNKGYKKNSGKSKMGKVIADVVRKLNQAVFRINGKTACLFLVPIKLLTMVLIPAE